MRTSLLAVGRPFQALYPRRLQMLVHRRPATSCPLHLLSLVLLLSTALHAAAQDCQFSVGELKYDLSELGGTKVLSRTRESPPSAYVDELRFDLCADLTEVENRASEDQVCLKWNGSFS